MDNINFTNTNIFFAAVQAIVIPVNCYGVNGGSLAIEFKNLYPRNYQSYLKACKEGLISIGKPHVFITDNKYLHKIIINMPVRQTWKDYSTLKDLELCLETIPHLIEAYNIKSLLIPVLEDSIDRQVLRDLVVKKLWQVTIPVIVSESVL